MALHEDLAGIDQLEATTTLFGVIQSGDIQSPVLHDEMAVDFPGISSLPVEIMGLLNAMGHSDEYTRGAGLGALLVVRVLTQYAKGSELQDSVSDDATDQ